MTQARKIRKAVLPVGGLGTRFLPATKAMPKEMMPILDKPLIHYAVDEALKSGIEEFIFITGRGKTAIVDYFDRSYELNHTLRQKGKITELGLVNELVLLPGQMTFVRQQEPLGLGHAVWCARNFVGNEPFAVILADDLILSSQRPCLEQLINAYDKDSCNIVAVMDVPESQVSKYGILDIQKTENQTTVFARGMVEKPTREAAPSTLAAIGRYILDPFIFDVLSRQEQGARGEIQLTDAIDLMAKEKPLTGVRFDGKRYDCGDKAGFLEATIRIALEHEEIASQAKDIVERADRGNI